VRAGALIRASLAVRERMPHTTERPIERFARRDRL